MRFTHIFLEGEIISGASKSCIGQRADSIYGTPIHQSQIEVVVASSINKRLSTPFSSREKLIESSGIPYTVIRSTQFVDSSAPRKRHRRDRRPERAPFNEIVARYLKAVGEPLQVVSDPDARYFGGRVEKRSLVLLAKRASAASVWTNGSAAHRQKPDPASRTEEGSKMHPLFAATTRGEAGELNPLLPATERFADLLELLILLKRLELSIECSDVELLNDRQDGGARLSRGLFARNRDGRRRMRSMKFSRRERYCR